jgi:hypothetical protein
MSPTMSASVTPLFDSDSSTHYASYREVASIARKLPDAYLLCKVGRRHFLVPRTASVRPGGRRGWDQSWRCIMCGTIRLDERDNRGRPSKQPRYVHPDGYRQEGLGYTDADANGAYYAELQRRVQKGTFQLPTMM